LELNFRAAPYAGYGKGSSEKHRVTQRVKEKFRNIIFENRRKGSNVFMEKAHL